MHHEACARHYMYFAPCVLLVVMIMCEILSGDVWSKLISVAMGLSASPLALGRGSDHVWVACRYTVTRKP